MFSLLLLGTVTVGRAQELCESVGGRPGLPIHNGPYGLCGRKATLKNRAQELCESGGGRPGPPGPHRPYGLCGRKATLNLNTPNPTFRHPYQRM